MRGTGPRATGNEASGACGGQAPALRANEQVSRQKTERKERSMQQRRMRDYGEKRHCTVDVLERFAPIRNNALRQ